MNTQADKRQISLVPPKRFQLIEDERDHTLQFYIMDNGTILEPNNLVTVRSLLFDKTSDRKFYDQAKAGAKVLVEAYNNQRRWWQFWK